MVNLRKAFIKNEEVLMLNIRKVAIIGVGNVGATTAYALAQSGLFSEIVLIDINRARTEGEAENLCHAIPFLSPAEIYAGDYADIKDAAIIIITAGAAQKGAETRLDLIHGNLGIFKHIIGDICRYNTEAIGVCADLKRAGAVICCIENIVVVRHAEKRHIDGIKSRLF